MADENTSHAPAASVGGTNTSGGAAVGTNPGGGGAPGSAAVGGQGGAPASAPASSTPGLSREDIAEVVGATVRNVIPQQPNQPQLTQQEIDQALRVFRPTAALLKKLRSENEEEGVAALSELVQGIHAQSTTLAQYLLEQRMGELTAQMTPMQRFVAEQQQNALRDEFFKAHPDLRGFDPILTTVRDQMVREGLRFKNKDQAFAECARRTKELLKTLPGAGGQASGAAGGTPAGSGSTPTSQMSTLTGGGQGGAGAGGGQQAPKPAWASLYS